MKIKIWKKNDATNCSLSASLRCCRGQNLFEIPYWRLIPLRDLWANESREWMKFTTNSLFVSMNCFWLNAIFKRHSHAFVLEYSLCKYYTIKVCFSIELNLMYFTICGNEHILVLKMSFFATFTKKLAIWGQLVLCNWDKHQWCTCFKMPQPSYHAIVIAIHLLKTLIHQRNSY